MISYVVEYAIVLLRRFTQETGISDPKLDFYFRQRLEGERWAERYSLTWRKYSWFHGIYGSDLSNTLADEGLFKEQYEGMFYNYDKDNKLESITLDRKWMWNKNPRKKGVLTGISSWNMPVFRNFNPLLHLVQLPDNPNEDKFEVGRITID